MYLNKPNSRGTMLRLSVFTIFVLAIPLSCEQYDDPLDENWDDEELDERATVTKSGCEGKCSSSCRCSWTEIGCNSDQDCQSGLYCKMRPKLGNRCLQKPDDGGDSTDNNGDCHEFKPGHGSYCSSSCRCNEGEGDCDDDSQCNSGLVCKQQSGTDFCVKFDGGGNDSDCHEFKPGHGSYCSSSCQCNEGEGDCDDDSQCKSGLVCKQQSGTDFCVKSSGGGDDSGGGGDDSGGGGDDSGGGGSGGITKIATTVVYDPNGQNLTIARPSGVTAGDLLILVLHRTDDDLPLYVNGWKRVAECYKSDNGQECRTKSMCADWHNANFCQYFGTDKWKTSNGSWVRYNGHDLAQSVFFKKAGSSEPGSYRFNLNRDSSGHPGWAILTALRGANTTDPVRDWSFKGCDGSSDSVFPSVYGVSGDMLLLSQSFDDAVARSKFGAPAGTTTFGYVDGERKYVSQADQNTSLKNDETGFLFGGILKSSGETGKMRTIGSGASSCKDILVSLTIKPR